MKGRGVVVALLGVLVMACASGPPASHYVQVLDELRIPARWELAHERVVEPGRGCEVILGSCPAAYRYYLVSGRPADAYRETKQMVIDSGFQIEQENPPDCVGSLSSDRVACYLIAVRGPDLLYPNLFEPGVDPDELRIARPGHFVILLRAYANPAQEDVP